MTRALCATCLRAQTSCICFLVAPTAHTVEVLILQHPMEVANAKGSARLLHLSLAHSRMEIGEVFEPQALHAWLTAPWMPHASPNSLVARGPKHAVLLYPAHPAGDAPSAAKFPASSSAPSHVQNSALDPAALENPAQLRLVVLDGTWRKSRKMLHLNPLLQQLPRLSLHNLPASRYLIRKAHQADQLSTLEATCAALAQIENNAAPFELLLTAFDGFVAQRLAYLPQ
jgi:DTW domain-containing protein